MNDSTERCGSGAQATDGTTAQQEPDVADILSGALQISRARAYDLMREAIDARYGSTVNITINCPPENRAQAMEALRHISAGRLSRALRKPIRNADRHQPRATLR